MQMLYLQFAEIGGPDHLYVNDYANLGTFFF